MNFMKNKDENIIKKHHFLDEKCLFLKYISYYSSEFMIEKKIVCDINYENNYENNLKNKQKTSLFSDFLVFFEV